MYVAIALLTIALICALALWMRARSRISELERVQQELTQSLDACRQREATLAEKLQALSRESDLMRALMNNIPDQIYFKDLESRFLQINSSVAEVLGISTPAGAIGKTDFDFFREDDAKKFRADDESVMNSGKTLVDRVEQAQIKSAVKWMSTTKAPVFDAAGKVIGLVGISRDITERKKVEAELEYERDLLNALLDNMPDQIYFKDAQCRFIKANHAVTSLLIDKNVIGKTDLELFPPEEAAIYHEREMQVLTTGVPLVDDVRRGLRHGDPYWVSVTKVPVRDKSGKIVGLVGMNRDVTARKQAEDLLREIIARAECVLWHAEVTDQGEKLGWDFNMLSPESFKRWLGITAGGQAVGALWSRSILPEHLEQMNARSASAIRGGQSGYKQEFAMRGVDGNVHWMAESVEITPAGPKRWKLVGVVFDITENKRVEQALRESEAQLRLLVEQMPAILWSTDKNLRFTSSLGAGLSMLGLRANELVGQTLQEYFKTKDENFDAIAAHRKALKGESPSYVTQRMGRSLQTSLRPMRDSDGSIAGIVGLALDVTERNQVQDALREREYLLREVLDTNPNLIMVRDAEGKLVLANKALADFYQVPMEEVVGVRHVDLHARRGGDPTESASWSDTDRQIMENGRPIQLLTRATQPTGRQHWFRTKKLPLTLANGVKSVLVICEDISDLKAAEEDLAKERDLLQALMDNVPDNIYFKDTQSRFIRINTYQGYHLGLASPLDAVGKTDFDFYPADRAREFFSDEREVLAGRRIVGKVEKQFIDGSPERWTLTSKVPFYGRDGKVTGLVGVSKDITHLKRMEHQLADANEQLNKLAREDVLTGLLNRRMILELADNEWARWQRYGKTFSVLVIDADDFKSINDTYGHQAGDQALKYLAARLSEAIRAVDIVGRYGGEEFVILLPETTAEGAVFAAEKALQNVRKSPLHLNGTALNLTISIGIASVRREDKNIDMLLHRADSALYVAKRNGKNQLALSPS